MNSTSLFPVRAVALSSLVVWLAPRFARAEDAIHYKYQDYEETGGRIAVKVNGAVIDKDFGQSTHFKIEGVTDAITGATPNGQPAPAGSDQVPLSHLTERRKAWDASLSQQIGRFNVALGAANSRESDYVSNGWSFNTLTDFNQKNTTLLAGVAGTDDDIRVFFQTPHVKKRGKDFVLGVTQLLSPRTSASLNFTWGASRGYLSDPYKLVQKRVEVITGIFLVRTFGENRPANKEKWTGMAVLNHSFPEMHAAVEASYRFYHDSNSTDAHTLDVTWFQHLGEKVILRPSLRLYTQSAASFYYYNLDTTSIVPLSGAPRRAGPFYSSDYRLSEMRTVTPGLKVVWNITTAWQVDAAYERYEMRGTDGVTPQSAYCRANIVTLGARFAW